MGMKTGRLGKEEKKMILEMIPYTSIDKIAEKLNRRIEPITEFVKDYVPQLDGDASKDLLDKLHKKVYWDGVLDQFSEHEARKFEAYWVELMVQFNEDVEFSEEMQMVDLIKVNLLINRNLSERNKAKREIEVLQGKLDKFIEGNGYPPYMNDKTPDIMKTNEYEILSRSVKACEASYVSRTSELNTLMNKKDAYFDELNATRKRRVEFLKNIKKDFVGLIKSLMNEKIRDSEGKELALMNLAADKEYDRLTDFHVYGDGVADIPILNSESINKASKDDDSDTIETTLAG